MLPQKLTFTFTGTIYEGKQKPELFLGALARLKEKHPSLSEILSVDFYGRKNALLENLIAQNNLTDVVQYKGILSRTKILEIQRASHVLVLFGWEDKAEKGIFQTKLFEYLAAHRPILMCGGPPDEESKNVIHEAKAGNCATASHEIESKIEAILSEYKKTSTVSYGGIEEKIMQFSYPQLAKKLDNVLRKAMKHSKPPLQAKR